MTHKEGKVGVAAPPLDAADVLRGADGREFYLRGRSSLKNNVLVGMRLPQWLHLIYHHWQSIDWARYWRRVLFLFCMSCLNTVFAVLNWIFFRHKWKQAVINDRPVFILGHHRSGTTLLHNLLSTNTTNFVSPTTFGVATCASYFLLHPIRTFFSMLVDKTRPMDNMPLNVDVPQEDEPAHAQNTPLVSHFASVVFMRKCQELGKFLTMREVSPEEETSFLHSLDMLLANLSHHAGNRRIVLKSPPHTARLRLLLKHFPNAQFVFIHRNPYRVFRSTVNLVERFYGYHMLQDPSAHDVCDHIFNTYEVMHDAYLEDRKLIPHNNLVEISFDDIQRDKIATIRHIYEQLGWSGFEENALSPLREHVENIETYKKNKFTQLSDVQRRAVNNHWGRFFNVFGYQLQTKRGPVDISSA